MSKVVFVIGSIIVIGCAVAIVSLMVTLSSLEVNRIVFSGNYQYEGETTLHPVRIELHWREGERWESLSDKVVASPDGRKTSFYGVETLYYEDGHSVQNHYETSSWGEAIQEGNTLYFSSPHMKIQCDISSSDCGYTYVR